MLKQSFEEVYTQGFKEENIVKLKLLRLRPGITNLENSEGVFQLRGYFGFSAEGVFLENTPLKKARKIGSSAFSVIKAKFSQINLIFSVFPGFSKIFPKILRGVFQNYFKIPPPPPF